jgi:hypothetical protein
MDEINSQTAAPASRRRTWAMRAAIATLIPAALLLVAACGSSSATGSGSSASPSSSSSRGSGLEAYRQCLAQNGVTLPSQSARPSGSSFPRPSGSPGAGFSGGTGRGGFPGGFGGGLTSTTPPTGVSASAWASAQTACASVRPSFGAGGAGGAGSTAFNAYISCLSDNGVKVSTASPQSLRSLDQTNATVKKAMATCKALLPQRNSGTTPGASASPSA